MRRCLWLTLLCLSACMASKCLKYTAVNPHSKRCLLFLAELRTAYDDAAQFCGTLGGRLISLHNAYDQSFTYGTAKKAGVFSSFWIGLTSVDRLFYWEWIWADGEESSYTNWGEGVQADYSIINNISNSASRMSADDGHWYSEDYSTDNVVACDFVDDGTGTGSCQENVSFEESFNKCFFFPPGIVTYDSALTKCKSFFGATLPSLADAKEQNFFEDELRKHGALGDYTIGLRRARDGNWRWQDNSTSSYRNWDDGFPMEGGGMDCVQVQGVNGKWLNVNCDTQVNFACQLHANRTAKEIDRDKQRKKMIRTNKTWKSRKTSFFSEFL